MDTDFADLRIQLATHGPAAAAEALCEHLRASKDYHALFYALLMKARVGLGVSPFPTGASADLPPHTHEPYEEAIRLAAREVGGLCLAANDLPRAWGFFRLIGEPGPVAAALDAYTPVPEDDTYPVVDIAWHQKVNPKKGFDIILDRHGICSAITLVSSAELSNEAELRTYCIRKLVRALYEQLHDRLRAELIDRGIEHTATASIAEIVAAHPVMFHEETYHIDPSHLSSVVQMAMRLPPCGDLELAGELCIYGAKLAPQYRNEGDPPFENGYSDYAEYLRVVAGRESDAGLGLFRAKAADQAASGNNFPAEILVSLLVRLDRPAEALAVAKAFLSAEPDEGSLSCPGVTELARRVGDYTSLAEAAQQRGDAVNFLAGLIAGSAQ